MTHEHNHQHHHSKPHRKSPHKDWRVWTAVVLMISAMAIYILSMDESIGPEGQMEPAAESVDGE